MIVQDGLGDVEVDLASQHQALGVRRKIETSDNAEIVGSSLESKPEVTVRVCRSIDHLARAKNDLVAIDVVAGKAISPVQEVEAALWIT